VQVLQRTGPLACTAANRIGMPVPMDADDAIEQVGAGVAICIDAGPIDPLSASPSSIVDTTVSPFQLVREGALSLAELHAHVGDLLPPA